MATRADWRLKDYTGRIRAEVRAVEARHAAVTFLALVQSVAMSGQAVPHPQIEVRKTGEGWVKLDEARRRRFWAKAGGPVPSAPA